jgi:4-hydroxy-3-polyprenylbenzoate decarboxylase
MKKRIVIALTGASGAGYGFELLKGLAPFRESLDLQIDLIFNDGSLRIMEEERGISLELLKDLVDETIHSSSMDHRLASGSNLFHSMAICPCTSSTMGKIHAGMADNLATRCASVALKERRQLILVLRETPLSTPVLKSAYELSSWGAVILPACPPFYGLDDPSGIDLQRVIAGRIIDQMGLENDLPVRYDPEVKS